MIDTIYLVGGCQHYIEDLLPGFAVDEEGIEKIVREYCDDLIYWNEFSVSVDMQSMIVTVLEVDGDCVWNNKYYIHSRQNVVQTTKEESHD